MRASRLLGIAVVTGVVTYAVRRDVHHRAIKRIAKLGTTIRHDIEDRALAFAISHMADGMTRAVVAQKSGPVELIDTVEELPER